MAVGIGTLLGILSNGIKLVNMLGRFIQKRHNIKHGRMEYALEQLENAHAAIEEIRRLYDEGYNAPIDADGDGDPDDDGFRRD